MIVEINSIHTVSICEDEFDNDFYYLSHSLFASWQTYYGNTQRIKNILNKIRI